jgi:hypothetical protein
MDSKNLAAIIGPTMMALGITEAANMDIFTEQTAPIVYLNGTLLLVAGLAILRAHGAWSKDWRVLITLAGWIAVVVGLSRMALPDATATQANAVTYAFLAVLAAIGGVLTYMAYGTPQAE